MHSPESLLDSARRAREGAYAPYSRFAVGAVVETADGSLFSGSNVENASYGLTLCAERIAIAQAVVSGHRDLRALAVAGPPEATSVPCGACRQFAAEFNPAARVTYTTPAGAVTTTLDRLLPDAFHGDAAAGT